MSVYHINGARSIEVDLVDKGARLYGYVTRGYVIDTGTMENYRRAERDVLEGKFAPKRAVSTR